MMGKLKLPPEDDSIFLFLNNYKKYQLLFYYLNQLTVGTVYTLSRLMFSVKMPVLYDIKNGSFTL